MGAGERNVTSAIYCVNHNSLHWNDVFSIIAATEVDSKVGEGLEVSNISSQQNPPKSAIVRSFSRPLPPLRFNLIISVFSCIYTKYIIFRETQGPRVQSSLAFGCKKCQADFH